MNITLTKLIQKIRKDGVDIKIENRTINELYNYGLPKKHVEVLNYINVANNDNWDGLILGYRNYTYDYETIIHTNMLAGVILVEDGNHKLIFKIPYKRGFNNTIFKRELNNYMRKYSHINNLNIKYCPIL